MKERQISATFFSEILKNVGCRFEENKDISVCSSVGISTVVSAIAYPNEENSLINTVNALNDNHIPFLILGRMSNVLFRSSLYQGVIIKTTDFKSKNEAENRVQLSCGDNIQDMIRSMAHRGYGGMEGIYGIPGSVGGMIRQNAGAYGFEISDRIISAECYIPNEKKVVSLSKDEMRFSYRDSIFAHNDMIILKAKFELVRKDKSEIYDDITRFARKRRESQPLTERSLGSVFKKIGDVSAGYYIERVGLKGYRLGGAQISVKHAGFIVNTGGATASDYLGLIEIAKNKVYHEYGIELQEEIQII